MKFSYYYKYNFVSPESLYAKVKEELKSYFQTGVIDDILFPKYTERCLKNLGRSSYKIEQTILNLEDFQATLPEGFVAIRELWLVTSSEQGYQLPTATYEQASVLITRDLPETALNKFVVPDKINVTYKTTGKVLQSFKCIHLLKPGNVHAIENCSLDSWNRGSQAMETFDIRGNKLVTNFPSGILYAVYYIKETDDNDYQLVPDNEKIQEYIELYLKYKCFETIYNNISDETTAQVERKMNYYEQKMWEAKAQAEVEIKKQTIEQQIRATKSARNRLRKYDIS
jgi:hypothetical protein